MEVREQKGERDRKRGKRARLGYLSMPPRVPSYATAAGYCSASSDLRQIFEVGRTMAVDNQSEISFSIPQVTLPWQPNFVGISAWVSLDAGG